MNPWSGLWEQRKRLIQGALWGIGMIALSVLIVYLLRLFEGYFAATPLTMGRYALFAYIGVFVVALLSNATIVIPAPGIALIIAAATQWDPVIVALVASAGGTLGELSGYMAGRVGQRLIAADHIRGYEFAKRRVQRHGYWIISLFAFIPLVLFDLVGLVAGALKIPVAKFLIAAWVGRIPRSFVEVFAGAGILHLLFPRWFT